VSSKVAAHVEEEEEEEAEAEGGAGREQAAFNIITVAGGFNGGRTYCLRVESESEMLSWVAALDAQVQQAKMAAELEALGTCWSRTRAWARHLYDHAAVQLVIAFIIAASFLTSMVEAELRPAAASRTALLLFHLEVVYAVAFSLELCVNVFGSWMRPFLSNRWNHFDTVVVVVSWLGILAPDMPALSLIRFVRVFRVLKLVRWNKSLQQLVTALTAAIIPVVNSLVIFMLFTSIYAVLATSLYGDDYEELFGSLTSSLFTMFQIATGDGWYLHH